MADKINGDSATNCLGETKAKNNNPIHNGQLQYVSLDHTHCSCGDQNSYQGYKVVEYANCCHNNA